MRKLTRDLDEDVRERVRALANTEAFQQSRRERKKVEMRFAHMNGFSGSTDFGYGACLVPETRCCSQPRRRI